MIKQWIHKFKEKLEQDKLKEVGYVAKKEDEVKERIEKSNNEMMSKWCPFKDGLCIGSECAHFKSAYYFYSDDQILDGVFGNNASCKLWGRR